MAEYRESGDFQAAIQYASARYARAVADEVAQEMTDLCPVDTGALARSINVEPHGDTVYVSVGGGDVDYALFVEYGTSRMRAQPFVRPALARRRDVVDLGGTLV
jgi:HK97 gp10 family phage protein